MGLLPQIDDLSDAGLNDRLRAPRTGKLSGVDRGVGQGKNHAVQRCVDLGVNDIAVSRAKRIVVVVGPIDRVLVIASPGKSVVANADDPVVGGDDTGAVARPTIFRSCRCKQRHSHEHGMPADQGGWRRRVGEAHFLVAAVDWKVRCNASTALAVKRCHGGARELVLPW